MENSLKVCSECSSVVTVELQCFECNSKYCDNCDIKAILDISSVENPVFRYFCPSCSNNLDIIYP